jgi:hypothetical protein
MRAWARKLVVVPTENWFFEEFSRSVSLEANRAQKRITQNSLLDVRRGQVTPGIVRKSARGNCVFVFAHQLCVLSR